MLSDAIKAKGYDIENLSKVTEIDLDELCEIINGKTPSLSNAIKISDALEIPLWEVIENVSKNSG
ncbi:MAG: helix-turn-helix domain-containing protein [Coprobacillaceae bacterium]